MTQNDPKIGKDTAVTLHFSLAMSDGKEVDSTFGGDPASFIFGDGKLPEGFQGLLEGMSKGQTEMFSVLPEKAFGMPNPNNQQEFKRSDFPADMELQEGLVVSFADANQSELPGVIKAISDSHVTVDFNHPLAGETLTFKVEVINVVQVEAAAGASS